MKKIIMVVLSIVMILLLSICFAATSWFKDVKNNHWAIQPIRYMNQYHIVEGYPDGTFQPDKTVTRAEFAKLLVKVFEIYPDQIPNKEFEDVAKNHWAYNYIEIASDYLPIDSWNAKWSFYPEEGTKREDVAIALVKAFGWENASYAQETLHRFSDKDTISENAQKYIAIAVENNIMKGNTDGTFHPQQALTRAEVCQVMYNAIAILERQASLKPVTIVSKESGEAISGEIGKKISGESGETISGESLAENTAKIDSKEEKQEETTSTMITPKPVVTPATFSLEVSKNENLLVDGKYYSLDKSDELIATIQNPWSSNNFIYYMFTYGPNMQNTIVKKLNASTGTIAIPEEMTAGNIELSIWGVTLKNNQSKMTETEIYAFAYSGKVVEEVEEEVDFVPNPIGTMLDDRKVDFKTIFKGDVLEKGITINEVRVGDVVFVRATPVRDVKTIYYKWDKEKKYTEVDRATTDITIPSTFEKESTHQLTVKVEDKNGKVTDTRKYTFVMSKTNE